MKSFVHNVIAHPLWWLTEQAVEAARELHDMTAPESEELPEAVGFEIPAAPSPVTGGPR